MDPNETLREIREIIAAGSSRKEGFDPDMVQGLVDAFEALDEWLSKGGFLPDAWGGHQPWHKTK